jgi:23S rRNA (guanosine2251-2'-O)-methyltransferase
VKKIYGIRPVLEALQANQPFEKIFLRKGMQGESFRELFSLVRAQGIPFQFVPQEKLNRISSGNHQGVIALLALLEYQKVENLLPMLYEQGETPFFVVLDRITDVRNLGAIARTAEAAGCHALVVPARNSALVNADAVKTSSGALMHLPVCREENLQKTLRFMKDSGLTLIAASEKGEEAFDHPDMKKPLAIILGEEEKGIEPALLRISDHLVSIPMRGKVESLNVSVAAGILIYEVVRQRKRDA